MIFKFAPESEFYTSEKCYIVELYQKGEDEDCSIARARVPPGTTTRLHAMRGVVERYVILDGEGLMEVDGGQAEQVRHLDVVTIPAGRSQRITNTGSSDLVFLCVCTPSFSPGAYVDLESGV